MNRVWEILLSKPQMTFYNYVYLVSYLINCMSHWQLYEGNDLM